MQNEPMVIPTPELPGIRRRTLDLLVAQILRNLAPILLLLMLARLTDQHTVGLFSLTLAIATPVFVFAQLGLRTVSLTMAPDASFSHYARVQWGAVLAATLAVVVVGAVFVPALLITICFVSLLKGADAFTDFLSGPLQRRHRSSTILRASIIGAATVSLGAGLALWITRSLDPTLIVVAALSWLVMALFLYIPAHRSPDGATTETRADVRRILAAGLPLGLTTAVLALISTFPQYVVTASQGAAETARFAVLLYVYALADLVTATIAQAWVPSAQERLLRGDGVKSLTLGLRIAGKWTIVYIPVTIIGLVLAAFVFPVVFGPGYTLSWGEAIPLGLAVVALPLAHFTAIAVAIENYYAHSLLLAAAAAVVAITTCLVLIPTTGLTGAFLGVFASVVTRAAVATAILLWFYRRPVRAEVP